MEIKNCKSCGKLFNFLSGKQICPECKQALEDKFQQVKEYIRDHGSASIQEVAEENEVDIKQIKEWVREERLVFSKDSPLAIDCEMCGAPIKSGRYCLSCIDKMSKNLAQGLNKPKIEPVKRERDGDRMRFLDKH